MILAKNWKFLLMLFFFEKGLDMMFDDVPERNEVFLDLKNVILGYSKKHFSFKRV